MSVYVYQQGKLIDKFHTKSRGYKIIFQYYFVKN